MSTIERKLLLKILVCGSWYNGALEIDTYCKAKFSGQQLEAEIAALYAPEEITAARVEYGTDY